MARLSYCMLDKHLDSIKRDCKDLTLEELSVKYSCSCSTMSLFLIRSNLKSKKVVVEKKSKFEYLLKFADKDYLLKHTLNECKDFYKTTAGGIMFLERYFDIKCLTEKGGIQTWARTYNKGRIRHVYYGMLKRCYDDKNKAYHRYGGRGITVCDEWKNDCRNFYLWAKENGYREGLTIDRIDNNKGYSPDNCRWTTYKVQSANRECTRWIEFNGERKTLKEWADTIGLSYNVLADRIYRYGWSVEKALTTDRLS